MSILLSFVKNQLLKTFEAEFVKAEPEMKAVIINEMQDLASDALIWAKDKISQTKPKD